MTEYIIGQSYYKNAPQELTVKDVFQLAKRSVRH